MDAHTQILAIPHGSAPLQKARLSGTLNGVLRLAEVPGVLSDFDSPFLGMRMPPVMAVLMSLMLQLR